jgi:hypothetical protein
MVMQLVEQRLVFQRRRRRHWHQVAPGRQPRGLRDGAVRHHLRAAGGRRARTQQLHLQLSGRGTGRARTAHQAQRSILAAGMPHQPAVAAKRRGAGIGLHDLAGAGGADPTHVAHARHCIPAQLHGRRRARDLDAGHRGAGCGQHDIAGRDVAGAGGIPCHPRRDIAELDAQAQRQQASGGAVRHLAAQVDAQRRLAAHVRRHQQRGAIALREGDARRGVHRERGAGQHGLERGGGVHAIDSAHGAGRHRQLARMAGDDDGANQGPQHAGNGNPLGRPWRAEDG